jgi:hypothetical protein
MEVLGAEIHIPLLKVITKKVLLSQSKALKKKCNKKE